MIFSLLVPTLIKGYLKNKYVQINEIFIVRKKECCKKKCFIVESLLFIGAGAGAGEKKYSEPESVKNGPAPQHWVPIQGHVSTRVLTGTTPHRNWWARAGCRQWLGPCWRWWGRERPPPPWLPATGAATTPTVSQIWVTQFQALNIFVRRNWRKQNTVFF